MVVRSHGGKLNISCQCRASDLKHVRQKGGGEYYEPMVRVEGETMWETYNNPDNHEVVFTEEDKVRT